MKNFGLFYCLFVVLLSVWPCCDESVVNLQATAQIEKVQHEDQKTATERCSVICSCNCCGQHIIPISLIDLKLKLPILASNAKVVSATFRFEETAKNIWQPPKIA